MNSPTELTAAGISFTDNLRIQRNRKKHAIFLTSNCGNELQGKNNRKSSSRVLRAECDGLCVYGKVESMTHSRSVSVSLLFFTAFPFPPTGIGHELQIPTSYPVNRDKRQSMSAVLTLPWMPSEAHARPLVSASCGDRSTTNALQNITGSTK